MAKTLKVIASESPSVEFNNSNKVKQLNLPPNINDSSAYQRCHEIEHSISTRIRGDKCHPNEMLNNAVEDFMISSSRLLTRFPHMIDTALDVAVHELKSIENIEWNTVPKLFRNKSYESTLPILFRNYALLNHMNLIEGEYGNLGHQLKRISLGMKLVDNILYSCSKMCHVDEDELDTWLHHMYRVARCHIKLNSVNGDRLTYSVLCSMGEKFLPDYGKKIKVDNPGDYTGDFERMETREYMAVINPKKEYRCQTRKSGRKSTAYGRRVKPHKLWQIKQGNVNGIFRVKKRERKGAVLIDASGSMDVHNKRLELLCSLMPANTIAFYCGNSATPSGFKGHLFIYAKRGLRTHDINERFVNGGNEVDLPALEWLLEQDGEKTLISDLHFCGGRDGDSEKAHKLLENHPEINVVKSLEKMYEMYDIKERNE